MKDLLLSHVVRLIRAVAVFLLLGNLAFAGPTTVTLASSANPSVRADVVTLTATVAGSSPGGTITFKNGTTVLGSGPVTLTNGAATYSTVQLPVGTHSLTAHYSGDSSNDPSVSAVVAQVVNKRLPVVALTNTTSPYAVPVLLSAQIAGNLVAPTGWVQFQRVLPGGGVQVVGSASVSPSGAQYIASFKPPAQVVGIGVHTITAHYLGDANYLPNTSVAVPITVVKRSPSVLLTVSPALESAAGAGVTLSAFMLNSFSSNDSQNGTITLRNGSTVLGSFALQPSSPGYVTQSNVQLPLGQHSLTAEYSGDAYQNSAVSAPVAHAIKHLTSTTVTASANSVPLGTSVTFQASVSGPSPTGTVAFKIGNLTLGSAAVAAGVASWSTSQLASGLHSVRAEYSGDGTHLRSASAVSQVVVAPGSSGTMSWQYGYDAMGRRHTVIDPNGLLSNVLYDTLGRPRQTQEPANVGATGPTTVDLEFNLADQLVKVKDPRLLDTSYLPNGLGDVASQTSPDTGTASATFDGAGNVLTSTDARGKVTTRTYDALGRLATVSYTTGTGTTFEYDGGSSPSSAAKGELTKITDESGSTTYAYDALGRLTSKTVASNGRTFVVTYTWGNTGSAMDKLTAITYPSGSRVNYTYDSAGFVSAITANPVTSNGTGVNTGSTLGMLSSITYNSDLNPKSWVWQDGSSQTYTYDSFGRLSAYNLGFATGSGTAAGANRTLMIDAAGRITGYFHANGANAVPSLNQTFTYDNLNRVLSATLSGTSTQYTYDETGNRKSKVIGGTTYTNTVSPTSNRLTQVQDVGGTYTITYDSAGNITNDGTNTFAYSDRGRMASATNAGGAVTYKYNGLEQRVNKLGPAALVPTGAAYFVYDEQGQLLGEYDANGAPVYETVYLGRIPVGVLKRSGTAADNTLAVTRFNVYADHLGVPRVVTRPSDRAIVWRWDSGENFGGTVPNENPSGLGVFKYNQRMPGQVFDSETGLFQNWHREYSPRVGRYIQSDPIGLAGGINTYLYADANPLLFTDPFGLEPVGHHFVPQSLWRNEPLLLETRRAFDRAVTGPIPGGHNYGDGHNKYNDAVRDMYEKWKTQNKIQCETMTPKQAEDFVRQVKQSTDPRIRDFNSRIYQRIISGAFRRIPVGRSGNE